ncbi:MAG: hypothetical protein ABH863_05805 [Candidatus Micrarchaeota archaeon]
MNLKIVALGIVMIVLALAVSVNAIDLKTSEDSISIHSTEGQFFAYVKNTASERRNLYLSVDGNKLSAFVEPYSTSVAAGASAGSYIRVVAPDCFRGSEVVEVYAQLCSTSGCETAKSKVIVYVEPAKFCSSYIDGYAPSNQFISGVASGSSDPFNVNTIEPRQSRLVFSDSYDTTSYSLRITGSDSCTKLRRGEVGRVRLTLSNRGAAGNFDLRVVTDSNIDAFTSKDYIALQRGGSEEVFVDIKPDFDSQAVRKFVTLQALHLDGLVAEKDVCIDLYDEFAIGIFAPSAVSGRTSKDMTIQVEVQNSGTSVQQYSFSASNYEIQDKISIDPQNFMLKPGARKIVDVNVDTSKLSPGTYRIQYLAYSEETQETAETVLKVDTDDYIAPSGKVGIDIENDQKDSVLTVFATIRNDADYNLVGLDLEVEGLPSGWEVSRIPPLTVRAGSSEVVEFKIASTSAEEASPVLIARLNGKTIASQQLPKIIGGNSGGFTGLFSLNSQNVVLGLIILAGIAVFLMIGRRSDDSEGRSGHDAHGHLESIKHEAGGHGR